MKYFLVIFAVIAVTQAQIFNPFGLRYGNYNHLGNYQNVISGGRAHIPLCFPNGFPDADAPAGKCYNPGFRESWDWRNGPCLPPVVNGKLVPPCQGQFYTLASYY